MIILEEYFWPIVYGPWTHFENFEKIHPFKPEDNIWYMGLWTKCGVTDETVRIGRNPNSISVLVQHISNDCKRLYSCQHSELEL